MKAFFSCIILVIAFNGFSQSSEIDSLNRVLAKAHTYKEKVDIYNRLSSVFYNYNFDKAYNYALEAQRIAEAANYTNGVRYALIYQGIYYYANSRYKEALALIRRSAGYEVGDDEIKVYNLIVTGNIFQAIAQYDSTEFYFKEALDIQSRITNERYKAYAFKSLARLYVILWKNNEALEYLFNALTLYEQSKNKQAMADTWFSIAEVYHNLGEFQQAQKYIEKGCAISSGSNEKFLNLYCYINQGELLYSKGNYTIALENLLKAVELTDSIFQPATQTRLYRDIGDVYEGLSQNEVALKYYLEALKIAERIGDKYDIAKALSGIASIYKNQHNYKLAFDFINKSLALRREIGDEHGISNSYSIKGVIYLQQKKYDSALVLFDKSLEIKKRIGYKPGIATCLYNKALVLEEKSQYQQALQLQLEALAVAYDIGNAYALGVSYNSIGSLYIKLHDYDKAQKYLQDAERLSRVNGSKALAMNNNFYMAQLYEAQGDFQKALEYHKIYADLNSAIYHEADVSKLAELQALYQVEKKDQEIELLNQSKQLQDKEITLQKARIKQQSIIIISIVAGSVLVLILSFKSYQYSKRINKANREITEQKEEIQAQSEELIEANSTIANINKDLETKIEQRTLALTQAYKELDTFFYRASHDFRRPLTTFLGLAEVASVTVKDANALELFDKVKDTAVNLDKMLVKLQSISDVGSQEFVYKEVLIKEIYDNVCNSFRNELQRRNITTSSDIRLTTPLVSYPAMVKIIIENIIENGIHFCGVTNPYIKLTAYNTGDYITIEVEDNGQGIPLEYQAYIFDMYYRGNERSKGNGLGLYIVKKAVEKLEGTISFVSQHNVGSTFTIMIPNRSGSKI